VLSRLGLELEELKQHSEAVIVLTEELALREQRDDIEALAAAYCNLGMS